MSRLSNFQIQANGITTTGTATSTIVSIDLSSPTFFAAVDNAGFYVEAILVGKDGSNNVISTKIARSFKRISGTLTALGAGITSLTPMIGDTALTGAVGILTSSGTIIQLQATGVVLLTITWNGYMHLTSTELTI